MNDIERLKACLDGINRSTTSRIRCVLDVEYKLSRDWNKVYPPLSEPGVFAFFDAGKELLLIAESNDIAISWASYLQYARDDISYRITDERLANLEYLVAIKLPSSSAQERIAIRDQLLEHFNHGG